MKTIRILGEQARAAARIAAQLGVTRKNAALSAIADALLERTAYILAENEKDLAAARAGGMSESLLDRLTLTRARVEAMASGVREVAALPDPVGEVTGMKVMPNGLRVGKKRVPLGVVGIIFEARPNVTVDAAALCLKAGCVSILRGGKEAVRSNTALAGVMRAALASIGLPGIKRGIRYNTPIAFDIFDLLKRKNSARAYPSTMTNSTVTHTTYRVYLKWLNDSSSVSRKI